MRCLLIGNYGVDNFGDEALKYYFLNAFPDIEWKVISAHPLHGELPRFPAGIRSFLSFQWIRTLHALKDADAVVFGGGTLFTDAESPHACFIWYVHARVAHCYKKPIFLAFQGIGPFRTRRSRKRAQWVIRHASFLSVRDQASMDRVAAWNPSIKVIQSFDPVYTLLHERIEKGSQKVFILIPRRNSGDAFIARAKELLAMHPNQSIRILSLEPKDPLEISLCNRLLSLFPSFTLQSVLTTKDMTDALKDASMVFTERYHGAIAALAAGIPFETLAQKPGDKLAELRALASKSDEELWALIDQGKSALHDALNLYVS